MPMFQAPFREATPDDSGTLAEFVQFASEGLALYLWTKLAGPGHDPWHIGRERVRSETGVVSYRNAIVAEHAGKPVSGLISYALRHKPEFISGELPAILVPLQELTDLAPDTWYVHVLAAYPEHRGMGHGSALLNIANKLAAAGGCAGLSLIVSDTNKGARKLYERCGYREAAHCKMVKEQWEHPGTDWVLLRRDV
jgi:ribosomal protein S18 acetylase RimI-like enzyme